MLSELLKGSKVLNKQEMKNVTGGAGSCPEGETLYTCTVTLSNGESFSGKACGNSALDAGLDVYIAHREATPINVSCE